MKPHKCGFWNDARAHDDQKPEALASRQYGPVATRSGVRDNEYRSDVNLSGDHVTVRIGVKVVALQKVEAELPDKSRLRVEAAAKALYPAWESSPLWNN